MGLARALRSIRLIVTELALVVLASVLFTLFPQVTSDPDKAQRVLEGLGLLRPLARVLQLDHILGSWWFLGTLILSAASLTVVSVEQWKRARRAWTEQLSAASFRHAPFTRTWIRRAASASPVTSLKSRGRMGLLGLPLFHTGLLLVVIAGFLRMLFGTDALVDLYEGETLQANGAGYSAQWPGPFAKPFALDAPLTFEKLAPNPYSTGSLKGISARVRWVGAETPMTVSINDPLQFGPRTFYLTQTFGPAAFLEVEEGGRTSRTIQFLQRQEEGGYGATTQVGGLELKLKGVLQQNGDLDGKLEGRVLRNGGLLYAGALEPGQRLRLPSGEQLILHDLRFWAQFTGNRDWALPLAYAGFLLSFLGALLLFTVVKVDTALVIEPCEGGERVWVALRPRRFAPLYAERFERIVQDNGGPVEPDA